MSRAHTGTQWDGFLMEACARQLTSIDDFVEMQARLVRRDNQGIPTLVIPAGTCCQASGANALIRAAKKELLQKKLTDRIQLRITGCHGFCAMEPSVLVEPQRVFYPKVNPDDIDKIIEAMTKGAIVTRLLFIDPETGGTIEKQDDIPFFKKQLRTIMGRNEKIDPIRIFDYIKNNGYGALANVISYQKPTFVLD